MIESFFKLLIGHALADYALQSAEMRKGKGRSIFELRGGHQKLVQAAVLVEGILVWPYVLTAHALINGGMVWLLTGNVWLGVAEFMAHWIIDWLRCGRIITIHTDQGLHIVCKVIWSVLV